MEHSNIQDLPEFVQFTEDREKKRFTRGIFIMTAIFIISVAAYIFSNYPLVSVLIGFAAEIFVFLKFCLPRILVINDKSFEATVVNIKKKTVSGGKAEDAGDVPSRFRVKLKLKDTENKNHTYTFYNTEADNVKNYFSIKDKVYHHKGIACPEKLSREGDKQVICLCCTELVDKRESVCPKCEMPLVK